jgi:hypothetical protein
MLDQQSAEQIKPQLIAAWTQKLQDKGDPDLADPGALAAQIVEDSFRLVMKNYNLCGPDPFRQMAANVLGLDLSRLPAKATSDDHVAEALFRSRMALHERRMRLPHGAAYMAVKIVIVKASIALSPSL